MRTLALKYATRVYAAGYTYAAYDQGEFFPLHDEGGGAWPDQALDPASDAFVAAFCTGGVLTSTADMANTVAEFTLIQTAPLQWQYSGLSPGSHTYTITDVLGRIVGWDRMLGNSGVINAKQLTDGQYWITVDKGRTKAISVIH